MCWQDWHSKQERPMIMFENKLLRTPFMPRKLWKLWVRAKEGWNL
jgi:hypothetical protein